MDKIDLTEILRGKEGIKLYDDVLGEVTLKEIREHPYYPIVVEHITKNNVTISDTLTKYGEYLYVLDPKGIKCTLFPSKENRDWSKFK